ncbi:16S rRNA (cytosine(1402)-N(4))-methyltransferase [Candidatus Kaiserbacteria bacterium RIFCSPHIGHO2_01_FULL_50_13]|uniref:Ribosomal RNA small subunit methyltransferase H n=1 Tax=Candidatus Kaiserbacteria bacterium RIFCSPLOWO2_01_FULL_50_24 TaxID=1798507 RepID=A0A1F6EN13_9BACT|nr:MAG: 16S rRNA (cytosine(1402)-N(4))-methyltransferase [Candidatus Kaiserbacteria bacterium RIFCSPHIGHO2_01_FULL_50_13]OGG75024.1 MAG: 16S rRNA (cytosine(1402)-N(4))-methyltransferase [Candidatus Kaiserbacteria bacterium RIFCSPLOWO2_01_FULL_50_24]OGG82065.1 MAG: 16S rRNA (cytosine(1402)-N(4))-methyltransferase [Candidatus Kaiserbacteria bacterium RIFCSPLOWO2_02_FULL_51_13]
MPVLLHEAIQLLAIKKSDTAVDATLGEGGHTREILKQLGPQGVYIGIDADGSALRRAQKNLSASVKEKKTHFVQANFRMLTSVLETLNIQTVDKVLFDLGWNSAQLSSGRGFSFRTDEPLRMTFDDTPHSKTLTAAYVVNEWSEETLRDILTGFGEERYARRIALMIVLRREKKKFDTARELADAIYNIVPPAYRHGKIHPATRTFQALRIAVNDELGAIQEGFEAAWNALSKDGRIAFITFHSVEARLVKNLMREKVKARGGRLIVKRAVMPSVEEVGKNPRSRSATLRVIEKQV